MASDREPRARACNREKARCRTDVFARADFLSRRGSPLLITVTVDPHQVAPRVEGRGQDGKSEKGHFPIRRRSNGKSGLRFDEIFLEAGKVCCKMWDCFCGW